MVDYKGQGALIAGGGATLAELKAVCKYAGWRDTTASGETALTRFINDTLYILTTLAPWPEFLKRDGEQELTASTDEYTLDETNIDRLGVVERAGTTLPLEEISIEDWLYKKKTLGQTGTPLEYTVEKGLNGGVTTVKMLLYPCPTETDTLYYSYFRKPDELVNSGDVADWPNNRVWLFIDALETRLASGKKDVAGFSLHNADFMQKVYKAMGDARGSYLPIKVKPVYDSKSLRIRDHAFRVQS